MPTTSGSCACTPNADSPAMWTNCTSPAISAAADAGVPEMSIGSTSSPCCFHSPSSSASQSGVMPTEAMAYAARTEPRLGGAAEAAGAPPGAASPPWLGPLGAGLAGAAPAPALAVGAGCAGAPAQPVTRLSATSKAATSRALRFIVRAPSARGGHGAGGGRAARGVVNDIAEALLQRHVVVGHVLLQNEDALVAVAHLDLAGMYLEPGKVVITQPIVLPQAVPDRLERIGHDGLDGYLHGGDALDPGAVVRMVGDPVAPRLHLRARPVCLGIAAQDGIRIAPQRPHRARQQERVLRLLVGVLQQAGLALPVEGWAARRERRDQLREARDAPKRRDQQPGENLLPVGGAVANGLRERALRGLGAARQDDLVADTPHPLGAWLDQVFVHYRRHVFLPEPLALRGQRLSDHLLDPLHDAAAIVHQVQVRAVAQQVAAV